MIIIALHLHDSFSTCSLLVTITSSSPWMMTDPLTMGSSNSFSLFMSSAEESKSYISSLYNSRKDT